MRWQFRSFRSRIFALVLGILVLTQVGGFIIVNLVNRSNAVTEIQHALEATAATFRRLMAERSRSLMISSRLLSADFAFKRAYATHDPGTILSALNNHRRRIDADVMMLVSMQRKVIANTLHPERVGEETTVGPLLDLAEDSDYGEASRIVLLDGLPYQAVVVPLLIPVPDAWIVVGFRVDDAQANSLRRLSASQVSLVLKEDAAWRLVASTLDAGLRPDLERQLNGQGWSLNDTVILDLGGEDYVSLVVPLGGEDSHVVAVLQRSLTEALAPMRKLAWVLAGLFAVALLLSMVYAIWISRSVTRPVLALAEGARRVSDGDYNREVSVRQADEIGELADSFNLMMQGLSERDRVRDLLGKVVSPAIAEELMSRSIELGGEKRVVSVLFSDVRNFTSLCEGRAPEEILTLLNRYLTQISRVIDEQGGVVDKYIGDAVMALFGAPVPHEDDASRAIRAAFAMCQVLAWMNAELERTGQPTIAIGVGINTGEVVAGNMGSETRMNYTVIGDNVNLASRLEGLSKVYGVSLVVSEATRDAAPEYVYRRLDRVRVKGKNQAVEIYEPLGTRSELKAEFLQELSRYEAALSLYQQGSWGEARQAFEELAQARADCLLYQLYHRRCTEYEITEPEADEDGGYSYSLDTK